MSISHFYIPSPGQPDGAARATALGVALAPAWLANEERYASRITGVPCVVCDHGDEIVVLAEPTTVAAITAAHDALLEEHVPTTVPHTTDVTNSIATHAAAVNPHSITPAGIGASPTAHTHSYEAPGAVATHAAAVDPHPTYLTQAEGDAAYSVLAHVHATPAAGVMRVAAPQTMTLTAQTAVTGMSFAVAANATYYFEMTIVISTSTGTAPTTAWGFTGPASPTAVGIAMAQDTSTSVQVDATITSFTTFAAGAQVASTGVKFTGVVQTSAGNAGTVALTAARAGTTPSMVVAAGSNGFFLRVA